MMNMYLNNFNRYQSVEQMLFDFSRFHKHLPIQLIIVDNESQRSDTLEMYNALEKGEYQLPYQCSIIRQENLGPRGFWPHVDHGNGIYGICDPDLDLSQCPDDSLLVLKNKLESEPSFIKVGLSIEINDIPDEYPLKDRILSTEGTHWEKQWSGWWVADIDTHFALCLPNIPFGYGPALRSPKPYVLRHLPFYEYRGNITEDFAEYMKHLPATYKSGMFWSTLTDDNSNLFLDGDRTWKNR